MATMRVGLCMALFTTLHLMVSVVWAQQGGAPTVGEASVPSQEAIELHHSLHRPLDQSQVYWNFGGSTVLTKNSIRLTPSAQNRRGWLWNDYPLESENWEITFTFQIQSKPHFGGDGMGIWLLHSSLDPTFQNDPTFLNGEIFGMRKDFRGLGIVIDVYDNDGRRNNPSLFVLYNQNGTTPNYNHDNDYQDDMYKRLAPKSKAYSCVATVRNAKTPSKMMIKYIQRILHVYIDTDDGLGYKFCLALEFEEAKAFKDYHIAFTAMTGQVADSMEVFELSTRYLPSDEKQVDDSFLRYADDTPRCSTLSLLLWTFINIGGFLLIGLTIFQWNNFRTMKLEGINPVHVCQKVNTTIIPHYGLHAVLSAMLLFVGDWTGVLMNIPLLAWRVYQISTNTHQLTPMQLGGDRVHGGPMISFSTRLILTLISYVLCQFEYLVQWSRC